MSTSSARRRLRRQLAVALSALLTVGWSFGSACAQGPAAAFPARVIRIVPFGTAGGPIDAIARLYAEKLQQRWGQTVIVEPQPGRQRHPGRRHGGQGRARRLHDADHTAADAHQQRDPAAEAALRPGEGLHAAVAAGDGRPDAGRARSTRPTPNWRRFVAFARRHPGLTYGTWGNGSHGSPVRRTAQAPDRPRPDSRAVQGRGPAHHDMVGGVLDFAWANPATARGADPGRQASRCSASPARAGSRRCRSRDLHRAGLQGLRPRQLDRRLRTGEDCRSRSSTQWTDALREITAACRRSASELAAFGFEPLGNDPKRVRSELPVRLPARGRTDQGRGGHGAMTQLIGESDRHRSE